MNRKVQSNRIAYTNQKRGAWVEVVLNAPDQLCQRNGWNFHKIFATSNDMNADPANTESNLHVLDTFTRNCFATFRDVMFESSLLEEMVSVLLLLHISACTWTTCLLSCQLIHLLYTFHLCTYTTRLLN